MFKMSRHAQVRLQEAANTKQEVSVSKIIRVLDKKEIIKEGENMYIPLLNMGLFAIKPGSNGLLVLTTFISRKRLGKYGKAKRAFEQAISRKKAA
jgi:hypothetical protein